MIMINVAFCGLRFAFPRVINKVPPLLTGSFVPRIGLHTQERKLTPLTRLRWPPARSATSRELWPGSCRLTSTSQVKQFSFGEAAGSSGCACISFSLQDLCLNVSNTTKQMTPGVWAMPASPLHPILLEGQLGTLPLLVTIALSVSDEQWELSLFILRNLSWCCKECG